jgi:hypothetical protein
MSEGELPPIQRIITGHNAAGQSSVHQADLMVLQVCRSSVQQRTLSEITGVDAGGPWIPWSQDPDLVVYDLRT